MKHSTKPYDIFRMDEFAQPFGIQIIGSDRCDVLDRSSQCEGGEFFVVEGQIIDERHILAREQIEVGFHRRHTVVPFQLRPTYLYQNKIILQTKNGSRAIR
ncbi:MAG: hypothetical protein WC451_03375 [Patescibacteria group bacterium]